MYQGHGGETRQDNNAIKTLCVVGKDLNPPLDWCIEEKIGQHFTVPR